MKIILAKLKDFKTPHFHYLMKIYDKNYEVFYHPLYFKIYTNSMLVNDTWINLHSKKYDCKISEITNNEYNMLLSEDSTIVKIITFKIFNDNYGNIDI